MTHALRQALYVLVRADIFQGEDGADADVGAWAEDAQPAGCFVRGWTPGGGACTLRIACRGVLITSPHDMP